VESPDTPKGGTGSDHRRTMGEGTRYGGGPPVLVDGMGKGSG